MSSLCPTWSVLWQWMHVESHTLEGGVGCLVLYLFFNFFKVKSLTVSSYTFIFICKSVELLGRVVSLLSCPIVTWVDRACFLLGVDSHYYLDFWLKGRASSTCLFTTRLFCLWAVCQAPLQHTFLGSWTATHWGSWSLVSWEGISKEDIPCMGNESFLGSLGEPDSHDVARVLFGGSSESGWWT